MLGREGVMDRRIQIEQPNRFFKGLLNAGLFTVLIGAVIYFVPRIIIGLSDKIIEWSGGNEVYLALFVGIGVGIILGVIFCEIIRYYGEK
jgi:hypothetical protein